MIYMFTSLHSEPREIVSTEQLPNRWFASAVSKRGEHLMHRASETSFMRGNRVIISGEQSVSFTSFSPLSPLRSGSAKTQSKCSVVEERYSSAEQFLTSTLSMPSRDRLCRVIFERTLLFSQLTTLLKRLDSAMVSTPSPQVRSRTLSQKRRLRSANISLEDCSYAFGGIMALTL